MSAGTTEATNVSPVAETTPSRKKVSVLKKVLIAFAAIVVVFLGVVAVQPSEFRVTRTATIDAPLSTVFAQVNDFHNWEAWSPWAKLDPAAKNTFEGPSKGTGAIFAWDGNDDVGAGSMTVTESRPDELIKIKLEFTRPFQDASAVEFAFQPAGDQTVITWSMFGRKNFMCKAVCLFMSMDKMIGGDFEKGLASMKSVVEAKPQSEPSIDAAAGNAE